MSGPRIGDAVVVTGAAQGIGRAIAVELARRGAKLALWDVLEDGLTDQIIGRYLEPLVGEGIDTLVLGCTHYPLLMDALSRALGEEVKLVDSALNCATAVEELLDRQQLRTPSGTSGGLEVALTDLPDSFLHVARDALQLDIGEVHLRDVLHPTPH